MTAPVEGANTASDPIAEPVWGERPPGIGERGASTTHGGADYAALIDSVRQFLDRLAGARPDLETIRELGGSVQHWADVLATTQVRERDQVFARRTDLPGRGQTMAPALHIRDGGDDSVTGTVTFGRFYLGGNRAVHGGAVPLLFDEIMGRLANNGGRPPGRTAYLHVNYRSITPIDVELQISARIDRIDGRKRFITGELYNGDTLCADAEGLFVQLKPGQP